MKPLRSLLVFLQAVFVATGIFLLLLPMLVHGGDPRTYPAGFLFGSLFLGGLLLALLWLAGHLMRKGGWANFSLASLGMLSATAMAFTYDLVASLAGLAYLCWSFAAMETHDVISDVDSVERSSAARHPSAGTETPLGTVWRKLLWTAGLATASCILSVASLALVVSLGGVLAATSLSFLSLSLLGWICYNLASSEDSAESGA